MGVCDVDMVVLCKIGLCVEYVMFVVIGGVNMYCGVIFGFGLLCVVVGWCVMLGVVLVGMMFGVFVLCWWGVEIFGGLCLLDSYGECVSWCYGVGGVCCEVVDGFLIVYVVGLLVLCCVWCDLLDDLEVVWVVVCFVLIVVFDDMNLLYWGG